MAEQSRMIIPTSVRDNEIFREDLARFVRSSAELKRTLYRDVNPIPPYGSLSDAQINQFSNELGYSYEEIQRIISVFSLIKQQLLDTGQTAEDAVSDIGTLLGDQVADDHRQELLNTFYYLSEERREYLALLALALGPAYLSASLRPSLVSTLEDTELVGVCFMTISYLNTEVEQRSVTFGITHSELEQLESSIADARRQLEEISVMSDTGRDKDNEGLST